MRFKKKIIKVNLIVSVNHRFYKISVYSFSKKISILRNTVRREIKHYWKDFFVVVVIWIITKNVKGQLNVWSLLAKYITKFLRKMIEEESKRERYKGRRKWKGDDRYYNKFKLRVQRCEVWWEGEFRLFFFFLLFKGARIFSSVRLAYSRPILGSWVLMSPEDVASQ